MGRRASLAGAIALGVLGCAPPDKGVRVAGTTSAAIAVGAMYRFAVIDDCDYAGPGFVILGPHLPLIIPTPPSCLSTEVDRIVEFTFSDPAVFEVTQTNVADGAALFEVRAVRPGTTTFRATISTSTGSEYTASGEFTAEVVSTVDLVGDCSGSPGSTDTLIPIHQETSFRPVLLGMSGKALTGFGYTPISVDGVPITLNETDRFVMPARASVGEAIVTSSADPAFRKALRFISPASITSLEIVAALPVIETARGEDPLTVLAKVGVDHSCFDYLPRRIVSETPSTCGLVTGQPAQLVTELTSNGGRLLAVRGLARNTTCRVRAEMIGGSATTTLELPIREGWTKQAPPTGITYLGGISTGLDRAVLVGTKNAGTGSAPLLATAVAEWDGSTWTTSSPSIPANATNTGRLEGIAGAGTTLFAVGTGGAIVTRTGGGAWTEMASGTTANLSAVHALSATDAIAVGDAGTVVRLAGGSWQPVAAGVPATTQLRAVWGSGPGDLYVAGDDGILRHFDGASWTAIDLAPIVAPQITTPMSLRAVWGSGPDDVYVGGSGGTMGALAHWDGSAWTVAVRQHVEGIWGSGPDDVHVTGKIGFGEVTHWDGMAWTERNVALYYTIDVWGWSTEEVFVMAYTNELWRYR